MVKEKMLNIVKKNKEVINYLIYGVLTTLLNIAIYFLLTKILYVNFMISNIIAWIGSVIFAFITNKLFVFENTEISFSALLREGMAFVGVRLLSGGMDMGLMYMGVKWLLISDGFMKIVSNILVIALNYIASKWVVFRRKG